MVIEGERVVSTGLSITYHAQAIRDAIEDAHRDGFYLDDSDEREITGLDLNHAEGNYVRIIRDNMLLRIMEER